MTGTSASLNNVKCQITGSQRLFLIGMLSTSACVSGADCSSMHSRQTLATAQPVNVAPALNKRHKECTPQKHLAHLDHLSVVYDKLLHFPTYKVCQIAIERTLPAIDMELTNNTL
jgi:hypothetical protein